MVNNGDLSTKVEEGEEEISSEATNCIENPCPNIRNNEEIENPIQNGIEDLDPESTTDEGIDKKPESPSSLQHQQSEILRLNKNLLENQNTMNDFICVHMQTMENISKISFNEQQKLIDSQKTHTEYLIKLSDAIQRNLAKQSDAMEVEREEHNQLLHMFR